jgi:flagellar basal-body rod modification protein FlgD
LDKDAFLKLLIAQMKYQDPLNPMDDKEFLGQMAQFTALEQMQNLNATFSKSQAYSMIGKTVYAYYPDPVTGQYNEITGLVSAVTIKNGEAFLYVEGEDIPASAVSVVGDDYFMSSQLNAIYESVSNTRDMNFVGRYIQALIMDGETVTEYVEGKVDYVKFNGGQAVLVVDGKEVFPSEVASVSDDWLLKGKEIYVYARVDDELERIKVAIQNILINNNKAYLDVGRKTNDGDNVPIEKINYIMEALQLVGRNLTAVVDSINYAGTVHSVTVKGGAVYLNYANADGEIERELPYLNYRDRDKV